ncbi:MAG TPA: TIGR00266 family protein [Acidimicrobiales bacterium]
MRVTIQANPAFAFGTISIDPGGEVHVEAGAMAAYSDGVDVETKARGGVFAGLKRSMFGGETFFINTFRSQSGGTVSVAADLPGDMTMITMDAAHALLVQSGSWIASDPGVDVDTKWGGSKTFFSGKGLFLLRCTGQGDVLVGAYGGILSMALAPGQSYTLDTGHVVAFDESVQFSVHKAGNWKTTVLGGEGLVTRFTGPGRLWLQTRSQDDLVNWLIPRLPKQEK